MLQEDILLAGGVILMVMSLTTKYFRTKKEGSDAWQSSLTVGSMILITMFLYFRH